jgi:hypothetical protein
MEDTTLNNIGVFSWSNSATRALESSRALAEELNMLLSCVTRLLDLLGTLLCTTGQLFRFVFDLCV